MFWKFHAAPSASVDELLSKENVTLEELLDEEDIIQECKGQNSKVIDFLTQPDMMMGLVSHMVVEPDASRDVTAQYHYANVASEIVVCNIPAIVDQLASERSLLDKLYSLLDHSPPLNPLLASFFSRTLALLIVRRPDQVLEFLKSKENFIELVLKHIGTSAIMDLLCNLISGIEAPEYRQNALNWLNSQRLVQRLADVLSDSAHPERQTNAAQVIVSVVSCARQMALQLAPGEQETNPLVSTIETSEFVSLLLEAMLGEGRRADSGLVQGIAVLQTLLDTGRQAQQEVHNEADGDPVPPEPPSVGAVCQAILPRLEEIHRALNSAPNLPAINTPCGKLDPPLGATRLHVARLIAALIAANRHAVNSRLAQLGTIDVLMDLFFHYSLNNFLHSQVEQCVSLILESDPQETDEGKSCHPLLVHIFTQTKLVQRILEGMEEPEVNGDTSQQRRCCRSLRAYRGHLVNMANKICTASEEGVNSELVRRQLDSLPEPVRNSWTAFKEAKLNRINEKNRPVLPATHHDSTSESDYRISETQKAEVLKTFSNLQYSSAQCVSRGQVFEVGDDDEGYDDNNALNMPGGKLVPTLLATLGLGEQRPSAAELFEQQCAERFSSPQQPSQESSASPDMWSPRREHDFIHSSSDEDEDEEVGGSEGGAGHISMEVDTGDPWPAAQPALPMDTNPWESAPAQSGAGAAQETGWADFGAFAASPALRGDSEQQTLQQGEDGSGDGADSAETAQPSSGADPFEVDFDSAFSPPAAGSQPPPPPPPPDSMEVQPQVLVAQPVLPRPDSPHELNETGGDFTPLFHDEAPRTERSASTEPADEPTPQRLAENYSYLTSQGLMNGETPEVSSSEGTVAVTPEVTSPGPSVTSPVHTDTDTEPAHSPSAKLTAASVPVTSEGPV